MPSANQTKLKEQEQTIKSYLKIITDKGLIL